MPQHVNISGNDVAISFNRTAALPPPSPLASHPTINVRKDNMPANKRPSSRDGQDLRGEPASNVRLDGGTKERNSLRSVRETDDRDTNGGNNKIDRISSNSGGINGNNVTDFFSSEVFHLVLRNPATAHRLLRFCQSRACGENMEFLQKVYTYIWIASARLLTPILQVDQFNRLLDEASQLLGSIQSTYTSADAPQQINMSNSQIKRVQSDIRHASQFTIPSLESIFLSPREHIEKRLEKEIYPRFVKHQVTTSATSALADHRERFQGLGDCFCLTDPRYLVRNLPTTEANS